MNDKPRVHRQDDFSGPADVAVCGIDWDSPSTPAASTR